MYSSCLQRPLPVPVGLTDADLPSLRNIFDFQLQPQFRNTSRHELQGAAILLVVTATSGYKLFGARSGHLQDV